MGIFNSKYLQRATLCIDKHMITEITYYNTMFVGKKIGGSVKDVWSQPSEVRDRWR